MPAALFLLLLTGQFCACYCQSFSCPEPAGVCEVGVYPDPTSCAHYYNCIPGALLECLQTREQCEQYLAFDKNQRQCVLAIDAQCDVPADSLVFAGVVEGSVPGGNPLPLAVRTERGNQWNATSNVFTVAESNGVYFMGLSVRTPSSTPIDYILQLSGQRYAGIKRTSTNSASVDRIGRDVITRLYTGDTVHIFSAYTVLGYFSQIDTSLTLFSILDTMLGNSTFSVARQDSLTGYNNPLTFEDVLFNEGLNYDEFGHTFWPPSDGVYFFSFSVGLVAGGIQNLTLYKDDVPYVSLLNLATNHNGDDTTGRSIMMSLKKDEPVHLVNSVGLTARSSELRETSFCGFKYDPKHRNPVAWSVARTSSFSTAQEPVSYPMVLVNLGTPWQPASNTCVIPRAGYYFIHIGAGAHPSSHTYLQLHVNNGQEFSLGPIQSYNNGVTTQSRCGILSLSVGDVLHITSLHGGAYSDWGMQTIFIGFLLY